MPASCAYRGDSVGLATVGDLSCLWAVGGESSDNLSNVDWSDCCAIGWHLSISSLSSGNTGEASGSGSSSETHLDGIKRVVDLVLR